METYTPSPLRGFRGYGKSAHGTGSKARRRAAKRGIHIPGGLHLATRTLSRWGKLKSSRLPNSPRGFNAFRGRPVKHVIKSFAANGTPRDVKECGGLVDMHLRGGKKVRFNPSRARLCYKGNRLHIVGARFRKPNPPGEEDYGEILKVAYIADKPHLESDDGSRTYEHRFGEEGGIRPHLVVDAEGLPIISGGTYTIPTEGIRD